MSLLIPLSAFSQQCEEIAKQLRADGQVLATDTGSGKGVRRVSFSVDAPGYGAPTVARFEYRERFRRVREGWLRDEYTFEYLPQRSPGRRAHHLHRPWGIHQHCSPTGRRAGHYRDVERTLQAAHEAFLDLYDSDAPMDCRNLIRLAR